MDLGVTENGSGQVSSMRIGMYIALMVGALVSLSGAVGYFLRLEGFVELVFAGEGIMALALGAKAWQKGSEVRINLAKSSAQTQTVNLSRSEAESEATTRTEKVEGK